VQALEGARCRKPISFRRTDSAVRFAPPSPRLSGSRHAVSPFPLGDALRRRGGRPGRARRPAARSRRGTIVPLAATARAFGRRRSRSSVPARARRTSSGSRRRRRPPRSCTSLLDATPAAAPKARRGRAPSRAAPSATRAPIPLHGQCAHRQGRAACQPRDNCSVILGLRRLAPTERSRLEGQPAGKNHVLGGTCDTYKDVLGKRGCDHRARRCRCIVCDFSAGSAGRRWSA